MVDDLNALGFRPSHVMPARDSRVKMRPSGVGEYVEIGYCRIESDAPAALTVKNGLGARRVVGYQDSLVLYWLQTAQDELTAIKVIQGGLMDISLSWMAEDGSEETRYYEGYSVQVLPSFVKGEMKIIAERMISESQMRERLGAELVARMGAGSATMTDSKIFG